MVSTSMEKPIINDIASNTVIPFPPHDCWARTFYSNEPQSLSYIFLFYPDCQYITRIVITISKLSQ